ESDRNQHLWQRGCSKLCQCRSSRAESRRSSGESSRRSSQSSGLEDPQWHGRTVRVQTST
ncbi:hypothetical protein AVDCRST_MAG94-2982, partial [uncultured Leptolyngbya sp.]